MIGQTFGRLTVIEDVGHNRQGGRMWFCTCSCGGKKYVCTKILRQGKTESCGCLDKERVQEKHRLHTLSQQGKKGMKKKLRKEFANKIALEELEINKV